MNDGYEVSRPTLAERFWRRLGYRYHHGDEPEGTDGMPGWTCHTLRFRFRFFDRLRLLATGNLLVKIVAHTDVPSASVTKIRLDWEIARPGADRQGETT